MAITLNFGIFPSPLLIWSLFHILQASRLKNTCVLQSQVREEVVSRRCRSISYSVWSRKRTYAHTTAQRASLCAPQRHASWRSRVAHSVSRAGGAQDYWLAGAEGRGGAVAWPVALCPNACLLAWPPAWRKQHRISLRLVREQPPKPAPHLAQVSLSRIQRTTSMAARPSWRSEASIFHQ